MSEATVTEANTEATEAEETDSVEETTEADFAPFEISEEEIEAGQNSDQFIEKFFAEAKPLYNQLIELSQSFKALNNIDDAVESFLKANNDPAITALAEKLEKAKAMVAKIETELQSLATEHVRNSIAPGVTPEQIKRDYQDANVELNEKVTTLRPMFVYMGVISESKKESATGKRPRSVFTSNGTKEGDDFIKLLNRPSLSVAAPTGEGKLARIWAKATDWKDSEGKPVAERGKPSAELIPAWKAAGSPDLSEK